MRMLPLFLVPLSLLAENDWSRWRGPSDTGVAPGDVPVEFGESKNIAWRIPIPGRGFSSPVIWGEKIFLTTAVPAADAAPAARAGGRGGPGGGAAAGIEHKFVILCLDRRTGKTIWERTAIVATPHEGYHQKYGSFASNTPVTDGKRLFANFGSRGLYAYDMDGKLLWKRDAAPMKMRLQFGEGSPMALDRDRLFLKFDAEENSYVLAVNALTGKDVWRAERDENSSWSPPFVVEHQGKKQVVVAATNKVRSYDYDSGKLIWETAGLGTNVIPSPVTQNGIVYVMSGHRDPNLMAIRLGKSGDLKGTDAILWQQNRGTSYSPSPVLADNKLYMLTDNGMLSCLNAATGEPYYHQQRLPKPYNFKASPVAVNGKLYLSAENGDVIVVKMGEKFEILATNSFPDEMFVSSPAVAGGDLYLRTDKMLRCIRKQ